MSQQKHQKRNSERKHRMVNTFLRSTFPYCEVKYNGIEGVDHRITFGSRTTYIETKTCKKFIKSGKRNRLGQFKIDCEKKRKLVFLFSNNISNLFLWISFWNWLCPYRSFF